MKRFISIVLVFVLVALPCAAFTFASYDPDYVVDGVSVQVFQHNTSYAGWSNHSAVIDGCYTLGTLRAPQSLALIASADSVLAGYTLSPTVELDISVPTLGRPMVCYFAVFNTYGVFNSDIALDTYYTWSSDFYGYVPKTGYSSSFGYRIPTEDLQDFTSVTSSNRVANYEIRLGGTSQTTSGASFNGTATSTGVGHANTIVPQMASSGGGVYNDYYWYNPSGNNCYVYRVDMSRNVDATNNPWTTLHVDIPSSSLNKVTVRSGASSSRHIHSAVFVPLCVVYDSTGWDSDVIDAIDGVMNQLVTLGDSIHADLTSIINALGTGNITVISGISSMLTQLQQINSKLTAVTGNRYSSAIQYIEYYLSQVLSNTDTMVSQLNDITSTLSSIASTIQATNDQAEEIAGSSEDVHEQEQVLFEQANSSIGSTVIGSFAFDADTSAGMGRVGIDFTNLWNALGNWHNVYIFAMTLTLAFTIIRFTSSRVRSKDRSNKANQGG